jgi:hypothetical protein
MGLQLPLPTSYGVTACYWKVALTNIDWHNRLSRIELLGWPSQADRQQGAAPLATRTFDLKGEDFPFTVGENTVAEAYAAIKAHQVEDPETFEMIPGEFATALDV